MSSSPGEPANPAAAEAVVGTEAATGTPAAAAAATEAEVGAAPRAPEEQLDLRGEVCPFTFVRARLALEGLPLGATLTVVVDHPPALRNVPRSARQWGQVVAEPRDLGDGSHAIEITRTR